MYKYCFQCSVIKYFSWVAVPLVVESLVIFLFGVLRVTAGRRGVVRKVDYHMICVVPQNIHRIANGIRILLILYMTLDNIRGLC